jgi:hypothetical protein
MIWPPRWAPELHYRAPGAIRGLGPHPGRKNRERELGDDMYYFLGLSLRLSLQLNFAFPFLLLHPLQQQHQQKPSCPT